MLVFVKLACNNHAYIYICVCDKNDTFIIKRTIKLNYIYIYISISKGAEVVYHDMKVLVNVFRVTASFVNC